MRPMMRGVSLPRNSEQINRQEVDLFVRPLDERTVAGIKLDLGADVAEEGHVDDEAGVQGGGFRRFA